MTVRRRILTSLLVLVALAVASLAVAFSYDSPCGVPDSVVGAKQMMKAIVYRCYGSPEVIELEEVPKPTAADNEVLIKIHAVSINPLDWHRMRGSPYILRMSAGLGRPKDIRMGGDFAGTVEAIGKSVKRFKPGDGVFGRRRGAFAEYVTVAENGALVLKPANVTFEEAASVPVAAVTALQSIRDKGRVQPGHEVLINGASGGVGTFAVQIAKSFGAEVTGVCSTRNVALVSSIGADHVVDYTRRDFTRSGKQYDLVVDTVGNRSLLEYRRVLKPEGTLVIVGGQKGDWIGPLAGPIEAVLLSPFVSQELTRILADMNKEDLQILSDLMQTGKVKPVIDRRYTLSEIPAAIAYLEEGHARGKVVVTVE